MEEVWSRWLGLILCSMWFWYCFHVAVLIQQAHGILTGFLIFAGGLFIGALVVIYMKLMEISNNSHRSSAIQREVVDWSWSKADLEDLNIRLTELKAFALSTINGVGTSIMSKIGDVEDILHLPAVPFSCDTLVAQVSGVDTPTGVLANKEDDGTALFEDSHVQPEESNSTTDENTATDVNPKQPMRAAAVAKDFAYGKSCHKDNGTALFEVSHVRTEESNTTTDDNTATDVNPKQPMRPAAVAKDFAYVKSCHKDNGTALFEASHVRTEELNTTTDENTATDVNPKQPMRPAAVAKDFAYVKSCHKDNGTALFEASHVRTEELNTTTDENAATDVNPKQPMRPAAVAKDFADVKSCHKDNGTALFEASHVRTEELNTTTDENTATDVNPKQPMRPAAVAKDFAYVKSCHKDNGTALFEVSHVRTEELNTTTDENTATDVNPKQPMSPAAVAKDFAYVKSCHKDNGTALFEASSHVRPEESNTIKSKASPVQTKRKRHRPKWMKNIISRVKAIPQIFCCGSRVED